LRNAFPILSNWENLGTESSQKNRIDIAQVTTGVQDIKPIKSFQDRE